LAHEYDLNILGPNCLGFLNTDKNLNASFAKKDLSKGETAIVSQSGAFVTALMSMAEDEKLGFSKVITLGNKAVLDEKDFIDYLANDPKTKTVGFYLESLEDGRDFRNKLIHLSQKKPVLVLKAGNSKKVKKAIQSHTGSMAGETDVAKAAIEEAGALFFDNVNDFWNTLKLFDYIDKTKSLKNNKGLILTNAGGPGVVATDLFEKNSQINLLNPSDSDKEKLRRVLPRESSLENPIDILGDADPDRYNATLKIFQKSKEVGFAAVLITPQSQTDIKGILSKISKRQKSAPFPIFPVVMSSWKAFPAQENQTCFKFPVNLSKALERCFQYQKLNLKISKQKGSPAEHRSREVKEAFKIYQKAISEKRKVFYYKEGVELADIYEIKSLPAEEIKTKAKLDNLKINKKSILKLDDPSVLHKTAQGGVIAGISEKKELIKSGKRLWKKFPGKKLILQEQVEKGSEFIIGVKKDSSFGMVLMCGVGGILTEILDEKLIWILPAEKNEIKEKIKQSKIADILAKQGIDLLHLSDLVYNAGKMSWENPWIEELDINPAFLYSDKPSLAVDIKVKININS
jgi:acetyltransferase